MDESTRRLVPLTRDESLRLLETVTFGRVVFSRNALPAIAPVTHLVDADTIVIRSGQGAPIVSLAPGRAETVVAFEADAIDDATHVGWSVVVVGVAGLVLDTDEEAGYRVRLRQWVEAPGDQLIRITPEFVSGHRLTNGVAVGVDADVLPT